VELRNEADALVFRTEKLLSENAEQLPDDVKAPVTEAVAKLKEALAGDDNDAVKAALEDLNTKASAMGQAMYAAAQAAQANASDASDASQSQPTAGDDDVIDAEIVDDEGDAK
jgi:molecular chaperone DnaK